MRERWGGGGGISVLAKGYSRWWKAPHCLAGSLWTDRACGLLFQHDRLEPNRQLPAGPALGQGLPHDGQGALEWSLLCGHPRLGLRSQQPIPCFFCLVSRFGLAVRR